MERVAKVSPPTLGIIQKRHTCFLYGKRILQKETKSSHPDGSLCKRVPCLGKNGCMWAWAEMSPREIGSSMERIEFEHVTHSEAPRSKRKQKKQKLSHFFFSFDTSLPMKPPPTLTQEDSEDSGLGWVDRNRELIEYNRRCFPSLWLS